MSGQHTRPSGSPWFSPLYSAAFLIIGLLLMFHPMILSGLAMVQTDPGDPRQVNYVLEHSYQWISGNPVHAKFWDQPIFYPVKNTASYTDIVLGFAPLYWLLRLVGVVPDTAFQLWMIASGALNFLVCLFLLCRVMGMSVMAGTGGAYVFAFAGMRVSMLNGPQLLPQFFSLCAVACLFEIFRPSQPEGREHARRPSLWIAVFFSSVVLELYAAFYLGFFLLFGLSVALIVALALTDARRAMISTIRANLGMVALSCVASAVALSWMAYHYLISQLAFGARQWSEIAGMLPQLKSWINMGPANWLYGWTTSYLDFSRLPDGPEQRLGTGIVTFAVAVFGFWRMRCCTWGRIAIGVFVAALLLSLMYPWNWSPWQIVARVVPGASAIRCVSRIALLVLVPFSLAVAYALDGMKARSAIVALCLIMALEQAQTTSAYDKQAIRDRVQKVAALVPSKCKAFYFVTSPPESGKKEPWFELQIDGMWAQILTQVPTVNGFSGQIPPMWGPLGDLTICSRWDLLVAHVSLFRWADYNGLPADDLCLVTALRKPLDGPEPDVSSLNVDIGLPEARAFLGNGWGEDEWDKDFTWVWALGTRADLYVPLQPNAPYAINIVAAPMDFASKDQSMTVTVNGIKVAQVTMSNGMKSYNIPVPSSMVKDYNKITLLFRFAISPAALGKAPDTRPLAAAFDKIQFVRSEALSGNEANHGSRKP